MPSKSQKQHNYMAGCARNPEKMQGKCPPRSVAEEYLQADKTARAARTRHHTRNHGRKPAR